MELYKKKANRETIKRVSSRSSGHSANGSGCYQEFPWNITWLSEECWLMQFHRCYTPHSLWDLRCN